MDLCLLKFTRLSSEPKQNAKLQSYSELLPKLLPILLLMSPAHLDPKLSWSIFSVDGPLSTSSTVGTSTTSLSNLSLCIWQLKETRETKEKLCQRFVETGPTQTLSINVDQIDRKWLFIHSWSFAANTEVRFALLQQRYANTMIRVQQLRKKCHQLQRSHTCWLLTSWILFTQQWLEIQEPRTPSTSCSCFSLSGVGGWQKTFISFIDTILKQNIGHDPLHCSQVTRLYQLSLHSFECGVLELVAPKAANSAAGSLARCRRRESGSATCFRTGLGPNVFVL